MKNIKLIIFILVITSFNISQANDKYKKHNEIQYSKYYEKTDSIHFNSAKILACSLNTRISDTLYLTSNPKCSLVTESYTADLYLDFRIGDDYYNFGKKYGNEITVSCLVDVKLIGSTVPLLIDQPLTIKYNPSSSKLFYPQEILKVEIDSNLFNYTGIEVSLVANSINVSGATSAYATIEAKLQSQIQLHAFYKLKHVYNTSIVPLLGINSSYIIGSNNYNYIDTLANLDFRMVKLAWEINGCEEFKFEKYQIQILKLSNTISDLAGFKDNYFDVNTIVDWSEAITIEVGDYKKYIDIFLTQGKGVYTWRVRPIGNMYEGGIANSQNWGKWNTGSINNGDTIVYNHEADYLTADFFRMYINESIDDDLNWVHSRVFNESDESATKFYDEITYSDDLLGKRQYQKKVNSTDDNLTAEYYPDFHGNSVLSSLFAPISASLHMTNNNIPWSINYSLSPAPEHGSNLLYKRSTLMNGTDKYSFANFGSDKSSDVVNGGHIYDYYDESTEMGIPSSEGYPYTKSIYYNDGTNRLKEQRLPGPISYTNTSGIGKIRTFYATATERELVSLFGKEAPNPQKVFKVINIDQNNVYHYTYKGVDGKVIATAYRNITNDNLLTINNNIGHSFEITDKEYYITDYYPQSNKNQLTYKEEKDEFIEDGTLAQVIYKIKDQDFKIENICEIVSGSLIHQSKTPNIPLDIQIVVSNNGNHNASPIVINRLTSTQSAESGLTPVPMFSLPSSEPSTYKFSRTIGFQKAFIDDEVNDYKNDLVEDLKTDIFQNEIVYLNNIINGEPDHSIEQFRKNLVSFEEGEEDAPPNLDWGWKDVNGNSVSEGDPTSDGNFTKVIPSVGEGCNTYKVQIPQNICNTSSTCYLEKDKNDRDDYESMIIRDFASREVYENGGSDKPLDLSVIENYFWEQKTLSDDNIKRFIPIGGPYFNTTNGTNEGVFNKMVENMLVEVYTDDHYINASLNQNMKDSSIWNQEEICDCWNTAIDQFQSRGIIEDEETGREVINPKFSLMDAFLSCTGTMFKGYSNTPFENDTYCSPSNPSTPSTPLDDEGTFQVCYDHPADDINDSPLVGDGIRNPNIVLFGGGYFENAYKYLPLFIDEGQKDSIYTYGITSSFTGPCPCNTSVTGDFNDNYSINLNPEYNYYAGLVSDDPKNLNYYYQFSGINNEKTIGKIQEDADFYFTDYTYFRNEYKRVYDDWHGRTTYINFASDNGDNKKGQDKRSKMPEEQNPCNDENRADANKAAIMTSLSGMKGVNMELPPCMDCNSLEPCDNFDISAMLKQYVTACLESCDFDRFRKGVMEMFHSNSDNYYVVEGDRIRDFDFGTYQILYDNEGESTGEMIVVGGTPNLDEVTFSSYNIVYITQSKVNKYAAALSGNCEIDCQPKCFDPTVKKYVEKKNISRSLINFNPFKIPRIPAIGFSSKKIDKNDELTFDTECMLKEMSKIMKIISCSYEIQLPKVDCEGEPSYCEINENSDWETLKVGNYYIDENNKLQSITNDKELYKTNLVINLNSSLSLIKSLVNHDVNFKSDGNGTYRNYLPNIMQNYEFYRQLYFNKYRPLLYANYYSRKYTFDILKTTVNQFDPDLDFKFNWHLNCTLDAELESHHHYNNDINNKNYKLENEPVNGELQFYSLHPRDKSYEKYGFNYHYLENNILNLPDIYYDENVIFGRVFKDNEDEKTYGRTGIKTTSLESHSSFTFPPNFIDIPIYKKDKRNVLNWKGSYDNVQLFDYFTVVGDYIEINREIYNFDYATRDEFWTIDNKLKIEYYTHPDGNYQQYGIVDKFWLDNGEQLTRIVNDDGEKIIHIKGQFVKLPEFEEPDSTEYFCFRWACPGEDEFDQPFEHELIVNDCEFNEPDMYLEIIENQIEDIAYKLGEEYRGRIMESLQYYVYGEDNTEADDLDSLKVVLPPDSVTKFTLYYYDHHGNLVKTVPPKGVNVDKNRTRTQLAVHDMETMYQYNSTGQLVASKSADQLGKLSLTLGVDSYFHDGETIYIYDLAGRLRFTVNSNQIVKTPIRATYYRYDKRGRLIETGEIKTLHEGHDIDNDPDYLTVGDYIHHYLEMKEFVRDKNSLLLADSITLRKFYKYERKFSKYLLDSIDYPRDEYPPFVIGNAYNDHINGLMSGSTTLNSTNNTFREIGLKIKTFYDKPSQSLPGNFAEYKVNGNALTQNYLRNRISSIVRIPDSKWNLNQMILYDAVESHYSYDVHGNVDWYLQYVNANKTEAPQFAMLTHYEYDLISGNVTQIHYQPGKADEFTQIYDYDSDNRLKEVNTTRFGILKESDARYQYYKHGPLKRKEYGSDYVQGMDYYYTIQGWLKGINDVKMNSHGGRDYFGGDALTTTNRKFAYDAFAMSLNYFEDDYVTNFTNNYTFSANSLNKNLYNGNISSWQQVHNNLYNTTLAPNQEIKDAQMMNRINVFDYDISGRLDSSEIRTVVSGSISPLTAANSYSSKYQYDLNGNIMSMNRVSDQPSATTTTQTSSFQTYTDNSSRVRPMNRLQQVTNSSTGIPKDYNYDNMGNITSKKDFTFPPTKPDFHLIWTADGKIDSMIKWVYVPDKTNHSTMLEYKIITSYYYDGMGNKVMNIAEVDPDSVSAVGYRCNNDSSMYTLYGSCTECVDALGLKATYYGREAGGKTLALYDTDPGMTDVYNFPLSCTFNYKYIWLDDWYVYGSEADGRIATVDPKEIIAVNGSRMTGSEFPHPLNEYNASPPPDSLLPTAMRDTNIFGMNASYRVQQRTPDFRRYEIKDHLGNVRTVIADYKNPELTAPPISAWKYLADVKNISNMYPYGKSYGTNAIYNASEDYRYGFNGMEKEKNMDASGDISDFGARVFDANFPVFLSPDPLKSEFSNQSAYVFAGDNPIKYIDINGLAKFYSFAGEYMGSDGQNDGKLFASLIDLPNEISLSKSLEIQSNRLTIEVPPIGAREDFVKQMDEFTKSSLSELGYETASVFKRDGELVKPALGKITDYSESEDNYSSFEIKRFLKDNGWGNFVNYKEKKGISSMIHSHPAFDINPSNAQNLFDKEKGMFFGDDLKSAEDMMSQPFGLKTFGIISSMYKYDNPSIFNKIDIQFYDNQGTIGKINLENWLKIGTEAGSEKSGGQSNESD